MAKEHTPRDVLPVNLKNESKTDAMQIEKGFCYSGF